MFSLGNGFYITHTSEGVVIAFKPDTNNEAVADTTLTVDEFAAVLARLDRREYIAAHAEHENIPITVG